ncbi:MAG: hypothetical protein JXB88_16240 [Spirochaetales bacterium]|nr:hypothetical protein [Spirochaetales bacterium]
MKRIPAICLLITVLFAGCNKKHPGPVDTTGLPEGVFAYEKRVLLDMIDILERYNNKVFYADTPEKIAETTEEFCNKYEVLKPEIVFVTKKYPDWEQNPPGEMESIIKKYINANRNFLTMSLEIIKNNAEKYPDNEELIRSYERLKYFTTPSDKEEE